MPNIRKREGGTKLQKIVEVFSLYGNEEVETGEKVEVREKEQAGPPILSVCQKCFPLYFDCYVSISN